MRASTATPLIGRLWPTFANSLALKAATVVAGSLLLWASAKVSVPFWPVPMTMQVFAVLLLGLGLGARLAVLSVALYLMQGAMGLPVFQGTPEKGIGLLYLAGPTGGFLAGFLAAALVTGFAADRGLARGPIGAIAAGLIGVALIYGLGLAWLGTLIGWDKPILTLGFWPFIAGDLMKVGLAGLLIGGGWRSLERQNG
jgi:biotin transport system substrate-specific component